MADHWMTDYERAFHAANGGQAKVVICGGGWYRIATADATGRRQRKSDIVEMTARLEQRLRNDAERHAEKPKEKPLKSTA